MASTTVVKHTMASASSGQLNHIYRQHENYGNQEIDLSRAGDNVYFGCHNVHDARERLQHRIAELDEMLPPKKKRKDRVVAISYELPAPRAGMSKEECDRFFRRVYKSYEQVYGDDIICGAVHYDEVHEYTDIDGTKTMSRPHLHIIGIPNVADKGINGRAFYDRGLPNRLNKIADTVCMELFGYKYRDGSKQKSRGTVEQLKQGAKNARRHEQKELDRIAKDLQSYEQAQKNDIDEWLTASTEQERAERMRKLDAELDAERTRLENDLDTIKGQVNTLNGRKNDLEGSIEDIRQEKSKLLQYVSALRAQVESFLRDFTLKRADAEAELVGLQKQKSALEHQIELADITRKELSEDIKGMEKRVEELNADIATLDAQKAEYEPLRQQYEELSGEYKKLDYECKKASEDVNKTKELARVARNQIDFMEKVKETPVIRQFFKEYLDEFSREKVNLNKVLNEMSNDLNYRSFKQFERDEWER